MTMPLNSVLEISYRLRINTYLQHILFCNIVTLILPILQADLFIVQPVLFLATIIELINEYHSVLPSRI